MALAASATTKTVLNCTLKYLKFTVMTVMQAGRPGTLGTARSRS